MDSYSYKRNKLKLKLISIFLVSLCIFGIYVFYNDCNALTYCKSERGDFNLDFEMVYTGKPQEMHVCNMPRLTPVTEEILKLDYEQFQTYGGNAPPFCVFKLNRHPTLFEMDYDGHLIRLPETGKKGTALISNSTNAKDTLKYSSYCFYQQVKGPNSTHYIYSIDEEIHPISQNKTTAILPEGTESIYIWCYTTSTNQNETEHPAIITVYRDFLSHVPIKPEVEYRVSSEITTAPEIYENYPNILILGIDSTSHMNFRRYMPKAHDYLLGQMGAIEFHGINSLRDKTYHNIWPLLSGLTFKEMAHACAGNMTNCSLIWREFSKFGYRTSISGDAANDGILLMPAFTEERFDYDFRQVSARLESLSEEIDNKTEAEGGCYGSRLTFDVILENFLKTAYTFGFKNTNKPLWHLSWTSELTHNINYRSRYGEQLLLDALQKMHEGRWLNNSILILLSDHGMRSGQMREKTRQGYLEERMPLLYIVLPPAFKSLYPTAVQNMKENSNGKLVTTFDIYATMKHLLNSNLVGAQNSEFENVAKERSSQERGVSLFKQISPYRTCHMIGISSWYCACAERIDLSLDVDSLNSSILPIAEFVVDSINKELKGYPQCSQLKLQLITSAMEVELDLGQGQGQGQGQSQSQGRGQGQDQGRGSNQGQDHSGDVIEGSSGGNASAGINYEISFETTPGRLNFDATVFQKYMYDNNVTRKSLEITNINQISQFGSELKCVEREEIRRLCHCINN